METHLQREISNLKQHLLSLGGEVEVSIDNAYKALKGVKVDLAQQIIENDTEIDQREVDIEEECLKIMALYQPVASDLRMVIGLLKMNNDLERMGDLAANIAEYVIEISKGPRVVVSDKFDEIFNEARKMLRDSLDALVNQDYTLARRVCESDDIVDRLNVDIIEEVQAEIRKDPERLRSLMFLISISRSVERIADSATNISEDVIYMRDGEIVRHHLL